MVLPKVNIRVSTEPHPNPKAIVDLLSSIALKGFLQEGVLLDSSSKEGELFERPSASR